jgi:oxygen-independent coproporphyrinogen-3 oxidase
MTGVKEQTSFSETEELSKDNQFNERILTGLRTIAGVNLNELATICDAPTAFSEKIDTFIAQNWMQKIDHVISLTKEGRLRADYIASELFV